MPHQAFLVSHRVLTYSNQFLEFPHDGLRIRREVSAFSHQVLCLWHRISGSYDGVLWISDGVLALLHRVFTVSYRAALRPDEVWGFLVEIGKTSWCLADSQ